MIFWDILWVKKWGLATWRATIILFSRVSNTKIDGGIPFVYGFHTFKAIYAPFCAKLLYFGLFRDSQMGILYSCGAPLSNFRVYKTLK